ncbi:MAG: gamma-glutamylcyclotransferase [Spirochaetales bacterium]|nr:gamma-glutamylcyclotransferase [Spirochaetales bacterium]
MTFPAIDVIVATMIETGKCKHFFTYGTLRQGGQGDILSRVKPYWVWEGSAFIHGDLYDLGKYPGVVKNPFGTKVLGDYYRVLDEDKLFTLLDDYEECSGSFPEPREYFREVVEGQTSDKRKVLLWVYFYNWSIAGFQKIESGDYRAWLLSESG